MRLDEDAIRAATLAQIEAALRDRGGAGRRVIALLEQDPRVGVRRLAVRERRHRRQREAERRRRRRLRDLEDLHWAAGIEWVAGVDEVGRGCLAGPVVAAAVVLSPEAAEDGDLAELDDSKVLDAATRESLRGRIVEVASSWSVAAIEAEEIDRINILEASMKAMRLSLKALRPAPQQVLVDGNRAPGSGFAETAVVDGDARSVSIAAASVVAKVYRDELMVAYDPVYPGYGFASHKGYASEEHRRGLARLGPCPLHRRSFSPLAQRDQLSLGLEPVSADTGRRGEAAAADHLRQEGYTILHRAYRGAGGEIDLIARHRGCVVFVEVKTSRRGRTDPEERVGLEKRRTLIRCARQFLEREDDGAHSECRFDVIAVDLSGVQPRIDHFEDAFAADA